MSGDLQAVLAKALEVATREGAQGADGVVVGRGCLGRGTAVVTTSLRDHHEATDHERECDQAGDDAEDDGDEERD